MTCASEDDTWVTRFSNIQLSCWEIVLFKYFILNQKYNFPSLEKRCGILFWRVQRFIIKPKSLFGCQRAHKEKAFRWVRCVNQKYAEYFQLLWNFQKQHQYLQGPPFILPKGKLGNWQFNLALENRWITQGGVGWSKPSLDFHVWRPKYKVLLGVSAKNTYIPSLLFLGSLQVFTSTIEKAYLNKACDHVRTHSSTTKSTSPFYFTSTALVPFGCWETMRKVWKLGLPAPS